LNKLIKMSEEADVLLDGEEETGLQEEISQEDADKLLAEDEESYAYAELATGEGGEEWVEQEGVEGEAAGEEWAEQEGVEGEAAGEEWAEQEGVEGEADGDTLAGEAAEETAATDAAEANTEEKKENGTTTTETQQNYFRGGPRGRMMMMMRMRGMHPRFMLRPGMRPPPGFMPPPFMLRPGMRPPPGFRGRMIHPRMMRMRMPMRPFPPGHPMFRPGMRPFPPGHPMFRPGMRPPFPVPFPMGMMMGGEEEEWEEEEEEESEDGAKKIQTVIAGDPKTDRKRQAPMGSGGDHYNAAKRGRGAGGVFLRGAPPNMRGAPPQMRGTPPHMRGAPPHMRGAPPHMRGAPPHVRGAPPHMRGAPPPPHIRGALSHLHRGGRGGAPAGVMSYSNPVHQQTYVQPVRTIVEAPQVKSGTGQCHSNLRTIQCTDTPPQSQARPQVAAAVPQYRGVHNQYRVQVHHAPPPTLTSVPIQMSLPRSDKKVLVQNLPASVSYDSIKNMAVQYGPITSLEFKTHEKSAVIEFVSPNSAELFQRTHNRKMMDLAIINVTRLM